MSNVVNIFGGDIETDIPAGLSELADLIRRGGVNAQRVVVIVDEPDTVRAYYYGDLMFGRVYALGLVEYVKKTIMP